MTGSALVVLVLGVVHLVYTFHGPNLTPRDPSLQLKMQQVPLVISGETTMWKTWLGFNATLSLALILFGLIYGYLAWANPDFLFGSAFLLATGFVILVAIAVIARLYFFSTPFWGLCLSLACYIAGIGSWRLRLP